MSILRRGRMPMNSEVILEMRPDGVYAVRAFLWSSEGAVVHTTSSLSEAEEVFLGWVDGLAMMADLPAYKCLAIYYEPDPAKALWPENPVLISIVQRDTEECPICQTSYGPLVYGPGHTTRAHHHHPGLCGGIYVNASPCPGGILVAGTLRHQVVALPGFDGVFHGREFVCEQILTVYCVQCHEEATCGGAVMNNGLLCHKCSSLSLPKTRPLAWELRQGHLYFDLHPQAL